jgi:hypothetical protein
MKYLKTFENYTDQQPINFENVFGFDDDEVANVLGDLIDKFDYLGFEIVCNDYKNFKIEIYDEDFNIDTKQDLKDEYELFKKTILPNLEPWLDSYNIKLENHKLDNARNRIVISCKQIAPLKEDETSK